VAETVIVSMPLEKIRRGAMDGAECNDHSAPAHSPSTELAAASRPIWAGPGP